MTGLGRQRERSDARRAWRDGWRLVTIAILLTTRALAASAEDVSQPPILQLFESRWQTIEGRMPDIFQSGYGRLWLPPPERADSGNTSVGYDVYDRFDLGSPRNETLYGTETSLKTLVTSAHTAGVLVNTDFVANHDGFSNSGTVDTKGTATTADDVSFAQAGGYPGFALSVPGDVDGDFHGAFETGQENFRLSGLIDIAQDKNYQYIRQPVTAGDPRNIPAGTQAAFGKIANVPDPNNARFYPDQGLGGTTVFDPRSNQNVTLYDFNTTTPLAGDAVTDNAMGLLMRNARWMIQDIGVDGFRFDAARHFPRYVLDYLDQAMYLAKKTPLLDGSQQSTFSFSETGYDSDLNYLQSFIRKDTNNANPGQVSGNRDALDFNQFGALNGNLTSNGTQNNWHNIIHSSIDLQDDGLRNGSQGVAFAQSHDELGPYLQNVAYAYILMMPGQAVVYDNAQEFGTNRDFPRGGKLDALGGFYGNTITKLVDIRNTHGRGDFKERWIDEAFGDTNGDGQQFSNLYIYERSKSAIVGLNSRLDAGYDERTPVQTDFTPGTVLVELTGNAADPTVDPGNNIPEAIRVNASGQVTMRIPRNDTNGRGYVIYGVAGPQGTLSLTNVASVLSGATPTAANNGTARLANVDVVTGNTFNVRLDTSAVTLPAPFGESNPVRDIHADGDTAMIKVDGGLNINGVAGIDNVTPDSVGYGFENFTTTRTPGYIWNGSTDVGTGSGTYVQSIDTSQLSEGMHYITVRAFRHRDAATGGDGGPAVFTDFKQAIYVDRLPPVSAVASFNTYVATPTNPNNRDLVVKSVDGTASSMYVLLDLPANTTQSQILQMIGSGSAMPYYDRDEFVYGFNNLTKGNHVATVVTYEQTGNFNVQRLAGLFTNTTVGAGFGDMNSNGLIQSGDIQGATGTNTVEDILYSQGVKFRAQFDVNGDGLNDNRDLFALGAALVSEGATSGALTSYTNLLLKRADVDGSGTADGADVAAVYSHFGPGAWLYDMNVDGVVNAADISTMITQEFRTQPGDFNLDGKVDMADYVVWRNAIGTGTQYEQGDANLDGHVDANDYAVWRSNFGFVRPALTAGVGSGAAAVPESSTLSLMVVGLMIFGTSKAGRRSR